jgi:hypothetical protein
MSEHYRLAEILRGTTLHDESHCQPAPAAELKPSLCFTQWIEFHRRNFAAPFFAEQQRLGKCCFRWEF